MKTDPDIPINTKSWLGIGAVLAAIGASACCVGPFLLLSLGIGGAWMSSLTAMEPARPFFIILTLVFMALGYRKLYQKPSCCEEGADCTISYIQRRQRRVFWLGSSLILMLLTFPWLAPFFFVLRENNMTIKSSLLILSLSSSILWIPLAYAEATTAQPIRQQTVTLNIENMTCAMCTVTIKKALQKVDGVQQVTVDYDSKTAVVTFDTLKTDSEALIKATTDAGYPGTLATPVSR